MKLKLTKDTVAGVLVGVLLTASSAASVSAQPDGRRGRGFHGGRDGGPRAILRELDLSDEQREQLRALAEQGSSRETMERTREARKALNEAVESGADEGAIRQLAYDLGQTEGDAAVERARIHAGMMQILTPEQRQEYETLQQEREKEIEERRQRFQERRNRRGNRERDPL